MKHFGDPWVWRRHGAIDFPHCTMTLTRASTVSPQLMYCRQQSWLLTYPCEGSRWPTFNTTSLISLQRWTLTPERWLYLSDQLNCQSGLCGDTIGRNGSDLLRSQRCPQRGPESSMHIIWQKAMHSPTTLLRVLQTAIGAAVNSLRLDHCCAHYPDLLAAP